VGNLQRVATNSDLSSPIMSPRRVARQLWRKRFLFVFIVLAVSAVVVAPSLSSPNRYLASSRVLIRTSIAANQDLRVDRIQALENELVFARSDDVITAVFNKYNSQAAISVSSLGEASAIVFTVTSHSPQLATDAANDVAEKFIEVRTASRVEEFLASSGIIQEKLSAVEAELAALAGDKDPSTDLRVQALESQRLRYLSALDELRISADLANVGGASLIGLARTPSEPFSPKPLRMSLVGLTLGVIVAAMIVLLLGWFDDRVRSKTDLDSIVDSDVLVTNIYGEPRLSSEGFGALVLTKSSKFGESLRGLRAALLQKVKESEIAVLQVTSCLPKDGKTTLAIGTASLLVSGGVGRRVLLVDADWRRPRVHIVLGLSNRTGLASVLTGECDFASAITIVEEFAGLHVLTAGPRAHRTASDLFASDRFADFMADLRRQYDIVIIDSPPVFGVSDPLSIAASVDASIIVARAGSTRRQQILSAKRVLENSGANVIGIVVNQYFPKADRDASDLDLVSGYV